MGDLKTTGRAMTAWEAVTTLIRTKADAHAVIKAYGDHLQTGNEGIDLGGGVTIRRPSYITDNGDGDYYPTSSTWTWQWGDHQSFMEPINISYEQAFRLLWDNRRYVNNSRR
jgi:hypothetical protein